MTLAELITNGEGQTTEFKKSLGLRREALEALCAMVNADAARGTVVFGVGADGTVVGVEDGNLDSAQRSLTQAITTGFDPPLQPQVHVAQLEGKTLILLTAERLPTVPYHEYKGVAWIRQGSENRRATLAEKNALRNRRDRDQHQGPWKCNRCASLVGQLFGTALTDTGVVKSYNCSCGGEYWPCI